MSLSPTMSLFLSILLVSSTRAIALNETVSHEFAFSSCTGSRTQWNIITSCATTLFACAWTAIHPNMPGPAEGGVTVGTRRLGIMILALVAPEIVVMWAIRQFFAASMVQKRFQEVLEDGTLEVRMRPCSEPRLISGRVPLDVGEVRITITKEQKKQKIWYLSFLKETAKSLSHKLVSLVSSIHATFRGTSSNLHEKLGPSISVEELKSYGRWTLKHSFYAWMGGFMLFIDKDPAVPREIYYPLTPDELLEFLKADLVQMSMVSEEDINDRSKGDWLSKTVAVLQLACCLTYAFWWYKPKDVHRPVPVYWKEPGDQPEIKYSVPQSIEEFLRCQYGVKKTWIEDRYYDIFGPLLNLGGIQCVPEAAVKAHRVPYFCGYPPDVDKETLGQSFRVAIIGGLAGMVFGGVHCIAWNFTFPTDAERMLWRVASLTMAVMPGLALATVTYLYLAWDGTTTVRHAVVVTRAGFVIAALYVQCRLIVMVLMLLSLRSLPAGVYDEVCWTSHLPHW